MAASERTTLYLRGVPRRVVREAKAAAARAGRTLGRWVSERLEQAADPAPAQRPDTDAVRAAMAWYEANRRRLERKYPGEYVAIVGRRVVFGDAGIQPAALVDTEPTLAWRSWINAARSSRASSCGSLPWDAGS
jgi:hypothetical protein